MVIIDEAHERSLNIDLILALLRRELHGLPHLKVLIVSATINTDTFRGFFEPDFPVLVTTMKSKGIHPVHERWWAGPELPISAWPAQMPARAAATVAEILHWMLDGTRPPDIPADIPAYHGDILVFLTGRRPIEEAIATTRELIEADPVLAAAADGIELLPLYGELSVRQRDRPLNPATRAKRTKYRVIYSTNLAETSLTIDGIRHVVDTGLINRKTWDPSTATESMQQVPHSQHGLRQRRGRAGRTQPGVWHCLYSEGQFTSLDPDTPPEITRAPLPAVLLAAAVAGVADPRSLAWLAPGPPPGEIDRAYAALRAIDAVDEEGDPTPVGRELATIRTTFDDAAILVAADQAGCAIEAATVLAAKSDECKNLLLRWSTRWPATAKIYVDDVHEAILTGSVDDVDVVCRLWAEWEAQPNEEARLVWARRHFVDAAVMDAVERQRRQLLEPLMAKTRTSEVRPIDLRLLPRLRAAIAWASPNSLYVADRRVSNDERENRAGTLVPVAGPRTDPHVVAAMHTAGRPFLANESWVSRHTPPETSRLILLDRKVRNQFTTPLAPPERVLAATFCVVVEPGLIYAGDDWLEAAAQVPLAPPRPCIEAVPGDRFLADVLPSNAAEPGLRLLAALEPIPDPTIEIEEEDPSDQGADEHDELASDVGGRAGAAEESASAQSESADLEDKYNDVVDDEPPPTEFVATLPTASARLRADFRETAPHDAFEVVVTAVTSHGDLTCVPDTYAHRFAAFAAAHDGRTVNLILDHVRVFGRDRQPILIARHPESGFATPIDPRHIGTGLRYPQLRELPHDASWDFELLAADTDLMILELSQTAKTLQALTRLAGGRIPFRTTGKIVDVYLDALYMEITPDGDRIRPEDPPIVLRALARDLPQAADRIKIGATVPTVLSWAAKPRGSIALGAAAGLRLPPGPWEQHGDQLTITDALTASDWRHLTQMSARLPDAADAARFRAQATHLATRSLMPRLRIVDEQLFTAAVERGRTDATIAAVLEDGALRVSTPLGQQLISAREADLARSLGTELHAGSTIEVFVANSDSTLADLSVRLFDPAERERLTVGAVVSARLGAPTARGVERHVSTLSGVAGLARMESLPAGRQEGDVIRMRVTEKPSTGLVRFSGRSERHDTAIPRRLGEAIQPGHRSAWDLRPFTRLAGPACEVACDGTPPTRIVVFSDETPESVDAAQALVAAVTSELWEVTVPNHRPLRADNGAALRAISTQTRTVVIDGQRKNTRGYPERLVWVAAPNASAAQLAMQSLKTAYPQVWVSESFKRRGEAWRAAIEAVKARSAHMRTVSTLDDHGKPTFQAIIECEADRVPEVLDAARQACPDIPISGAFQTDPVLCTTQVI